MKRAYRKQANTLTPHEAAYLAGFVDGEGCITARLRRGGVDGDMEIASVMREQLVRLQEETGVGSVRAKRIRNKKAKQIHVWNISLCSLGSLLVQLLPYLRLKKKQAELMLVLTSYEYPFRLDDQRQTDIVGQFRVLNRRGVETFSAFN